MRRLSVVLAAAIMAMVAMIAPANAAKPASSYAIELDQAAPAIGTEVTFTVTGPVNRLWNGRIVVRCYQGGQLVYGENGPVGAGFKLGGDSSPWLNNGGGPASCTAELADYVFRGGKWTITYYAQTAFTAQG